MSEDRKIEETGMSAKKMVKSNADKKRKVKYGERMEIEIIKDTKYYKKGQIHRPHTVMAEELIKNKVAKAV